MNKLETIKLETDTINILVKGTYVQKLEKQKQRAKIPHPDGGFMQAEIESGTEEHRFYDFLCTMNIEGHGTNGKPVMAEFVFSLQDLNSIMEIIQKIIPRNMHGLLSPVGY
jgi:hypothetical protein